jgi:hypothetical protein
MKFAVCHYRGDRECQKIPGVYPEGEPASERHAQPYWIDIPIAELGEKLLEFAKEWDVMLRERPAETEVRYILFFDTKGYRFTQR